MKKIIVFSFILSFSDLSAGLLNSRYSLEKSLLDAQTFELNEPVVMLESGAPTGTLIHPLAVLTCAHATHIPGEIVKIVDGKGDTAFVTFVKYSLIPEKYKKAVAKKLEHTNQCYLNTLREKVFMNLQGASLNASFVKFGVVRGLELLEEQKGAVIYSNQESENDVQLLFLTDAVGEDILKPVPLSLNLPLSKLVLKTISYGPVYGENGVLREMNLMDQEGPYLKHTYTSYPHETNGKTIETEFLRFAGLEHSENIVALGSIVPGDSGSPAFSYNVRNQQWELQGLNVASENTYARYIPGVKSTICNLLPHVKWIGDQVSSFLRNIDQKELGYLPQLVVQHQNLAKIENRYQTKKRVKSKPLKPNDEGISFLKFKHKKGIAVQSTVRLDGLETKKYLILMNQNSTDGALSVSSRENNILVLDWFKNRPPGSVAVEIMQEGDLKLKGKYGGTMAHLTLPYGEYKVKVAYPGQKKAEFSITHEVPATLNLRKRWVHIKSYKDHKETYEGWVNGEQGLNLLSLKAGLYVMSSGHTNLPEHKSMIYVDPKFLSNGFVSVSQDRRHENNMLIKCIGLKGHEKIRYRILKDKSSHLVKRGRMHSDEMHAHLPWGNYLVEISISGYKIKVPYHHYKKPLLKANIQAVIDDQNEALFVASGWGKSHLCDLSLLKDGKYCFLVKDKHHKNKRLHVLVAHNVLPSGALIADLSGDESWEIDWFHDDVDDEKNFKFGYVGHMLDAQKSNSSRLKIPPHASKKFNIVLSHYAQGRKEMIEFVD